MLGVDGFFLTCEDFGRCSTIHSLPALIFFFKVEISLRTLIPLFRPGSVHSGSASWDDSGSDGGSGKGITVPCDVSDLRVDKRLRQLLCVYTSTYESIQNILLCWRLRLRPILPNINIIKRNIFVMELEEQVPATFNADSEHKLLSSSVYEYIHNILFWFLTEVTSPYYQCTIKEVLIL